MTKKAWKGEGSKDTKVHLYLHTVKKNISRSHPMAQFSSFTGGNPGIFYNT